MINYAHRGASEYAPENTISAFYLGLMQGANGIETDVQATCDGKLVLFHDREIDRVSDSTGIVSELSLAELMKIKIFGKCMTGFYDRILTLDEFLDKFGAYNIRFAIELKGEGVEEGTLEAVEQRNMLNKVIFTSFVFERIKKIKQLDPNAHISWLVDEISKENIERILSIKGEEIAPKAANITKELISMCKAKGLSVRAWGVYDISLMDRMCRLEVDGMTVNFPDKLFQYLNK